MDLYKPIPIWVLLYFTVYIAFSIWAHKDDLDQYRPTVWGIVELIGNVCLVISALSYWFNSLREITREYHAFLYILGVLLLCIFAIKSIIATLRDITLSPVRRALFAICGAAILFGANMPLLWFGYQLS